MKLGKTTTSQKACFYLDFAT